MKQIGLIIISVVLVFGIWYFWFKDSESIIEINSNTFSVEIADSPAERCLGLANRDFLDPNHGMLFIFSSPANLSFWMKDMKIVIDLLWIDNNKIVGYEENMLPPAPGILDNDLIKYNSPVSVDKVLELPAGSVNRFNLQIGDEVIYNL
ncbi:DUF192 domain-containing protein [bacterium]|nr:DUF192 domain-containing protein [bacterium]